MNKGTIEYGETILAVTDIRLGDGNFLIAAEGAGPCAEYHGPFRLYGPDGVLVHEGGHADSPAAGKHSSLRLEVMATPSELTS